MKRKSLPLGIGIAIAVIVFNVALLWGVNSGGVMAANTGSSGSTTQTAPRPEVIVVEVPFHNVAERDRLAAEWGATEANTAEGYLTFWINRDTYNRMIKAGLEVRINQKTTRQANNPNLFGKDSPDTFFGGYRTVEEMQAFLDAKVAAYPSIVEKIDIGDSWCKMHPGSCTQPAPTWNGYDLFVLHITNRSIAGPKPVYWYDAGIHSREIATPELAMNYIDYLLTNYDNNADAHWMIDYHDIWVMPMVNPDGHHMVEASGGPYLQRKNGDRDDGCTTWPPGGGQLGTDLNRNFTFQWGAHGGSSGSACSETYRGPSNGSEPETQAVIAKISSLIADQNGNGTNENNVAAAPLTTTGIYQNMHSYAQLNLYAWGGVNFGTPNATELSNIGKHMSATNANPPGNGYTAEQSIQLYATDGTTVDWGYGTLGIPAFTTELSDDGGGFFPAFNYTQNTIWPENRGMLLYMNKIARTPYLTARGPDSYSVTATPMTVTAGTPINLAATLSFAWTGNNASQNVGAAEYYIDTPPWAGGTAIPMSGSFGGSTTVNATATIDTTPLSNGRHIVFVRGRGVNQYQSLDTWGEFSAVFIGISGPPPTATATWTPGGPTATASNTATLTPTRTNTPTITPTPCGGGVYQRTIGTATIVPGTSDIGLHTDDGVQGITLPFNFNFYGQSYNSINVSSNGNAQFNSSDSAFANTDFPIALFNYAIVPQWDDLRTDGTGAGIFTSVTGSSPNRIFNIEWRANFYTGGTSTNFEIRLYESSGQLDMVYGAGVSATSATVGIQKADGSSNGYDRYAYNGSGSLTPGLLISYSLPPCGTPAPTNTPGAPTSTATATPVLPTATAVPATATSTTVPPTSTAIASPTIILPTVTLPLPTITLPLPTDTPQASVTPGGPSVTPVPPTNTPMMTDTPMMTTTPGTPEPTATLCPNPFVDINGNVFYNAIMYLYCRGVVNGVDSTHYAPAGTATRAQFAKVVVLGFAIPAFTPTGGTSDFTDVPNNYYAYAYIETGYHANVLSGYDAATCAQIGAVYPCYGPNRPITRAQLTKLVVNAGGFSLFTPSSGQTFTDVGPSNVFYTSIETAAHYGIVGGYPDNTFRPNNNIRRDEMAQIVYKGITTPPLR